MPSREKQPEGGESCEDVRANGACERRSVTKGTSASLRKLKTLFVFETGLFITACGILIFTITSVKSRTEPRSPGDARQYSLHSSHPSPFEDLNEQEVLFIKAYLQKALNLTDIEGAQVNQSYLFTVLLEEPWSKRDTDRGHRFATAIVFHGCSRPPVVREYRVGPLLKGRVLGHEHTRDVAFRKRPLSSPEFAVLKALVDRAAAALRELFQEQFHAVPQTEAGEEGNHVLVHQYTSTMVTGVDEEATNASAATTIRNTWFRFTRNVNPFYQYPIPLQMRVVHDGVDTSSWKIDQIWFRGKSFKSTQSLLQHCAAHTYKPDTMKWFRSEPWSPQSNRWTDSLPGAIKVDDEARLISEHWRLKVAFRSETGIRLFRIFHNDKLVAHELGLAETATAYQGFTPYMKRMFSVESMFGVGTYTFNLAPGIDCPEDAIFFSAWIVRESFPRFIDRAVCAFAHNPQDSGDGAVTVRSVTTLFNYDYVFDYTLHASGVIEVSVTASGNIHVDTIDAENARHADRGHAIRALDGTATNIYAPVHHHLFHFKADLDVVSARNNLFATLRDTGALTQTHRQLLTERYDSELRSSAEHFLTQCRGRASSCCYRTVNFAETTDPNTPNMFGFEASTTWAKHPLRVTRRRRNESRSSTIYNGVDPARPELRFEDFLNNDAIANADLVTWFAMGMLHIPHNEDLPFTNMPGGPLRTLLIPTGFNNCFD